MYEIQVFNNYIVKSSCLRADKSKKQMSSCLVKSQEKLERAMLGNAEMITCEFYVNIELGLGKIFH